MTTEENKTTPEFTQAYGLSEAQLAQNVIHLLNDNAHHLNPALTQRLSAARHLAVNHLANTQTVNHHIINRNGNALHWMGNNFKNFFGNHRAMSGAMMAGVMLLTFFVVQELNFDNNLENSDAFLLASDLPPEAYADKGFDKWLVSTRE